MSVVPSHHLPDDGHYIDGENGQYAMACTNEHEWFARWVPRSTWTPGELVPEACPRCGRAGERIEP
jgi:hypothetical protein